MPKRSYSAASGYRYGFNGKENDNDVKGLGNQQDYGMRIHDPRLGRFLSVDPLQKQYPELTPYQFASNTPIQGIDLDGREVYHYTLTLNDGKPILKYSGVEKRASSAGSNPFTDLIDGLFSNYEGYEGPVHTTVSVSVWVKRDGERSAYSFETFKNFAKWQKEGYPKKQIEVIDTQQGDQAALMLMGMTLQQQIDMADGDNDGYVQPGAIPKNQSTQAQNTKSTPSESTNNQLSAANNGTSASGHASTLRPGPYAKKSIPASSSSPVFSNQERKVVNQIGKEYGCHTCGSQTPNTKSGNWIPDHQPSSALLKPGEPQVLLPHCLGCSRRQGGDVNALKAKTKNK